MDARSALMGVLGRLGFERSTLQDATQLQDELDVDSTELVEVAIAVEKELGVSIDTASFVTLRTFGELVGYVEKAPPSEPREATNAANPA
jgi:acyl carrier protein